VSSIFDYDSKFVFTWQQAKNLNQATANLRLTAKQASDKANYLRSQGVPLKRFVSNGTSVPSVTDKYASLAQLAINSEFTTESLSA